MTTSLKRLFLVIGVVFALIGLASCGSVQEAPTTAPSSSVSGPTPVVVRILNLDYVLTVTPSPTPQAEAAAPTLAQQSPTPGQQAPVDNTAQPVAVAQASPTASCTNRAELVAHLSVSPNSSIKAGNYFAKVWRIRNVGDCTWGESYALVFSDGERMEAPESTPLGAVVKPGETVDLHLNLIAPIFPGVAAGNWYLQDGQGNRFAVGPDYGQPLQVIIAVQPPPAATSS